MLDNDLFEKGLALRDEIREVLMHSALYCGIRAAVEGSGVASQVIVEEGVV